MRLANETPDVCRFPRSASVPCPPWVGDTPNQIELQGLRIDGLAPPWL
jgi:hypothetical protein